MNPNTTAAVGRAWQIAFVSAWLAWLTEDLAADLKRRAKGRDASIAALATTHAAEALVVATADDQNLSAAWHLF